MNFLEAPSLVLLYCLSYLVFLLPGLAVVADFATRKPLNARTGVMIAVIASAVLGYLAFWLYLFNKTAGQMLSYTVAGTSAGTLVYLLLRREKSREAVRRMAFPFGYAALIGIFYCSLFFVYGHPFQIRVDLANSRFFPEVRPGDNLIPLFLAHKIYDRLPLLPFCCGDWLSSDRPPLQAGIFLLERPLRAFGDTGLQYQILGTILQSFWVCGVWALLDAAGIGKKQARRVLVVLVFSSFLFYNCTYVWPKLLAATMLLFLFAVVLVHDNRENGLNGMEAVLAALAFALAMMAHPGSVFSVPGLVSFGWPRLKRTASRKLAAMLVCIAAFVCPWMAYQKFVDPPGNRLPKMHLAGVATIDSRSTTTAILEEYKKLGLTTLVNNKWSNVTQLFGTAPVGAPRARFGIREWTRLREREYIFWALGVVNAGWLAAIILWLRGRRIQFVGRLLGAAGFNFLFWCLVMFGPAQTVVTHSSYADVVLLLIALSLCLLETSSAITLLLLGLEAIDLLLVWVSYKPSLIPSASGNAVAPHVGAAMLVLGICTGILVFGSWFWNNVEVAYSD